MTAVSAAIRFCRTETAGAMITFGDAAAAEAPKDKAARLRLNDALCEPVEALEKKTCVRIPRGFVRLSSNLDEFCNNKDFNTASVSVQWTETCLADWRNPYKVGYCSRDKKYSCAVYPHSEGCRGR